MIKRKFSLRKRLYSLHLLILLLMVAVAVSTIISYQDLPIMQFKILAGLGFGYIIWAFLYHYLDKTLTLEIIIEYILIVLVGILFVYGILF